MNEPVKSQTSMSTLPPRRAEGGASRTSSVHWSKEVKARRVALRAFQRRLAASQWFPPEEIERVQRRQLSALLPHAAAQSTYYKNIIGKASPADLQHPQDYLRSIPVLSRETVQSHYGDLCAQSPARHGRVWEQHSSGTTGQPVWVRRTGLCQMIWLGLTLRDHLWHRRDFTGTLASIRVMPDQPNGQSKKLSTWGEAVSVFSPSGPMHVLPVSTDVLSQAQWLASINPDYLLSYPSNLVEVLHIVREEKLKLSKLRELRTFGETQTERLREEVAHLSGVALTDLYSSQELGVIALQCPESGLYHIQSENLFVEVLNERGEQCCPGEVGRVVVTDLHNYAFPLIRYELGDYAEAGPACSCGRGLPTLGRVLGRQRNMVVLPNGQRHWPYISTKLMREAMPLLKQCQLVQTAVQQIEARILVTVNDGREGKANAPQGQERALSKVIQEALGYPFDIQFKYQTGAMEKANSGKFEEVVCNVL